MLNLDQDIGATCDDTGTRISVQFCQGLKGFVKGGGDIVMGAKHSDLWRYGM